MKRYILILLTVCGTFFMAKSQQKVPTVTELTTKSMDALEKKIKLNPTQRSIIYNYTLDLSRQQLELSKKQQAGNFGEDDMARFYKLQNETHSNIRNILKDQQQTDYDNYLEEQLRGVKKKKKKKGKDEEEEVVTGISGLKLPPNTTVTP